MVEDELLDRLGISDGNEFLGQVGKQPQALRLVWRGGSGPTGWTFRFCHKPLAE
jgi:hypothetical protein